MGIFPKYTLNNMKGQKNEGLLIAIKVLRRAAIASISDLEMLFPEFPHQPFNLVTVEARYLSNISVCQVFIRCIFLLTKHAEHMHLCRFPLGSAVSIWMTIDLKFAVNRRV